MRLIDADALKAKWYEINDIDETDRGARFVGYNEIARFIDHAPTIEPTKSRPYGDCAKCIHIYGTLGCCSTVNNEWVYDCDNGMAQYKIDTAEPNKMSVNVEYDVEYLPDKDGIHQAKATITKAEPSDDLISREEAIEQLQNSKDLIKQDGQDYLDERDIPLLDMAIEVLSAEAETKCIAQITVDVDEIVERIKEEYDITNEWISCSERLPKKGEVVLITNGKGNVRCGQYRSEYDLRDGTHYWWWKGKTVESVLAWMPLPEPYREDGEE